MLVAAGLLACSSLSPDGAAAGDAGLAFHAALSSEDGGRACELLSEGTRTELEVSSDQPCDTGILDEDLPSADKVAEVAAYGRNARAILAGDVVFLTVEGGVWKVMAAGCELRPNAPYDCTLAGR